MKSDEELMKMSIEDLRKESKEYFSYVRMIDAVITLKERRLK
jgi:hypothetical protein